MSQFIDQLSGKFALNAAEVDSITTALSSQSDAPYEGDKLDCIELFLAIALNAKLHSAVDDPRYKRLKFLLSNNSKKAVNLANLWADGLLSFEKMLATV